MNWFILVWIIHKTVNLFILVWIIYKTVNLFILVWIVYKTVNLFILLWIVYFCEGIPNFDFYVFCLKYVILFFYTSYLPNSCETMARYRSKAFCGTYSSDGTMFMSACQGKLYLDAVLYWVYTWPGIVLKLFFKLLYIILLDYAKEVPLMQLLGYFSKL